MHYRHGARGDAPLKSVAHDQIVARAKLFDERKQSGKVVAFVRVSHDHVFPLRCLNARRQSRTVATSTHRHDSRIHVLSNLDGTIGASIVGYNDLAGYSVLF